MRDGVEEVAGGDSEILEEDHLEDLEPASRWIPVALKLVASDHAEKENKS